MFVPQYGNYLGIRVRKYFIIKGICCPCFLLIFLCSIFSCCYHISNNSFLLRWALVSLITGTSNPGTLHVLDQLLADPAGRFGLFLLGLYFENA